MIKKMLFVMLLACLATSAMAQTNWTGGAASVDWFTGGNWNTGAVPAGNTAINIGNVTTGGFWPTFNGTFTNTGIFSIGTNYGGIFRINGGTFTNNGRVDMGLNGKNGSWIQTGGTFITPNAFAVGKSSGSASTLSISNGLLDVLAFYPANLGGATATVTQSGGEIKMQYGNIGHTGSAIYNMTGGILRATHATAGFIVGRSTVGFGEFTFAGGSIYTTAFAVANSSSWMDFKGGIMHWDGDNRDSVTALVNQGRFKTTLVDHWVKADYDAVSNVTTVYAAIVPEPGSIVALMSGMIGIVGFGIRRRK